MQKLLTFTYKSTIIFNILLKNYILDLGMIMNKTDKKDINVKYPGSLSKANNLRIKNPESQKLYGLRHRKGLFSAFSNMGETYSYITKEDTISSSKKALLLTGTTTVNIAASAFALPFGIPGAISYGVSRPFKWIRKKCFEHVDFDEHPFLSCFLGVIGSASYIVEKATKWVGVVLGGIASGFVKLANKINRKMITQLGIFCG